MRKVKMVKIDDREITIKELRVRDIYELAAGDDKQPMLARLQDALERCSDITSEALLDMAPSEIEELLAGFREVNAAFLDLAEKVGLGGIFDQIRTTFQAEFANNLQQRFAALSPPATEQ